MPFDAFARAAGAAFGKKRPEPEKKNSALSRVATGVEKAAGNIVKERVAKPATKKRMGAFGKALFGNTKSE